jgi:hypothetical protein
MKDRIRIGNRKDKLIKPIIEGDTFNEWKATVAVSGMFADIDNNNSTGDDAGVSEIGTPLNKANLLTDATRNKLGLSGDKSVNDGLNKLADMAIKTYTCTKSDTTFTLTGSGDNIKFVATADYAEGDTFTLNGTAMNALMPDGNALSGGFFKTGAVVFGFVKGTTIYFVGGAPPVLSSALPDSGTALTANAIYNIPASSPVGTYQFVAPSSGEAHGFFTTDTSVAITFGTGATYLGAAPSFSASTAYEFDVLNNVWAFTEVVSS